MTGASISGNSNSKDVRRIDVLFCFFFFFPLSLFFLFHRFKTEILLQTTRELSGKSNHSNEGRFKSCIDHSLHYGFPTFLFGFLILSEQQYGVPFQKYIYDLKSSYIVVYVFICYLHAR